MIPFSYHFPLNGPIKVQFQHNSTVDAAETEMKRKSVRHGICPETSFVRWGMALGVHMSRNGDKIKPTEVKRGEYRREGELVY